MIYFPLCSMTEVFFIEAHLQVYCYTCGAAPGMCEGRSQIDRAEPQDQRLRVNVSRSKTARGEMRRTARYSRRMTSAPHFSL
jgi:hypothetical protein